MITVRKAVDQIRHDRRQKRRVLGESALVRREMDEDGAFAQVMGEVPTPEFSAMVAEECRRLFEALTDPGQKDIVVAKLEGFSNQEIAEKMGCSLRTVGRQLHLIRRMWEHEIVG